MIDKNAIVKKSVKVPRSRYLIHFFQHFNTLKAELINLKSFTNEEMLYDPVALPHAQRRIHRLGCTPAAGSGISIAAS